MINKFYISLLCLLAVFNLNGQEKQSLNSHRISFSPGYIQIKEAFNYGLVNKGLDLQGVYRYTKQSEKGIFRYSSSLGFGLNYRQGLGMMFNFKPADFYYGFDIIDNRNLGLILGPYTSANYHWQIYPELQSGHLFWRSAFELGPRLIAFMPFRDKAVIITLGTAIASVGSRPGERTEIYHYSSTMMDFLYSPHQNMSFGLQNRWNHIELEIELANPVRNLQLAYKLDYCDYLGEPGYQSMIHSIIMSWSLGNSN